MKFFSKISGRLREFAVALSMKPQEASAEFSAAYKALPEKAQRQVDKTMSRWFKVGAAFGLLIMLPSRAFAAKNLGSIMDDVNKQTGAIGNVLGSASFLLGGFMAVSGISTLKKHSENPNDQQHTIKSGSTKLAGAAGLVGLGATLTTGMTTIFGDTNGNVKAGGQFQQLQ